MRKWLMILAAALTAAWSFADYVYQIKEPTPTVSYPAVSTSTDLVLSGGWSSACASETDTYFSAVAAGFSNSSALNARDFSSVFIIVR